LGNSLPKPCKAPFLAQKSCRLGRVALPYKWQLEFKYLAWQSAAVNLESRFCNFANLCRFVKHKF
ncbi:hypothetical protein, partial [Helicobacter bilis]|uniref:hypothetical protein n=1 Tax=Helicobacter bilis TaxID=37372 RepID=UPI00294265AE